MNKDIKTLNEVVAYLIYASDTIEYLRHKSGLRSEAVNLISVQKYLVASIECLKNSVMIVKNDLNKKQKELEEKIEEDEVK